MRTLFFFTCIALAGTFISCTGNEYPNEQRTIDSLKTRLEQAKRDLAAVDSGRLKTAIKDMRQNQKIISHYLKDTMNMETAILMGDYRYILTTYRRYFSNGGKLYEEADYSIKQLEDLRADLLEKKISPQKYSEYYEEERKAIDDLLSRVNLLMGDIRVRDKNFTEMHPKVSRIVSGLNTSGPLPPVSAETDDEDDEDDDDYE